MEKLWEPFFGRELSNSNNLLERTFVYLLRHTQMRPRQLIYICNAVAEAAIAAHDFPHFSQRVVRDALKQAEMDLAAELVNVFELTYPKADGIINAMLGMPKVFLGSELDKRARDTKAEWTGEVYSLPSFRQLVTELGIVGRVTKRNDQAGFIDAQFEYSTRERLVITPRDECVIHPMFYSRLDIDLAHKGRVMPFSVERGEIEEMQGPW